jgi:hypothetical protein
MGWFRHVRTSRFDRVSVRGGRVLVKPAPQQKDEGPWGTLALRVAVRRYGIEAMR